MFNEKKGMKLLVNSAYTNKSLCVCVRVCVGGWGGGGGGVGGGGYRLKNCDRLYLVVCE